MNRFEWYDLGEGVRAFSTTRHGGCSEGEYASFNINEYCGDLPQHVESNRKALCDELGIDGDHLVMPHQVHGIEIRHIAPELLTLPQQVRRMIMEGVDGLMTDVSGVCVGVSTADCIPVLLYDTEHHACCAVHAGWRGTLAKIIEKAIHTMALTYHSHPQALKAVIGPGISVDYFEVGDEVYEQFAAANFDMDAIAKRMPAMNPSQLEGVTSGYVPEKWHIDLWACNRMQMESMGVPAGNIRVVGKCTYSHNDDFFSARRQGVESGRIFTGIILD